MFDRIVAVAMAVAVGGTGCVKRGCEPPPGARSSRSSERRTAGGAGGELQARLAPLPTGYEISREVVAAGGRAGARTIEGATRVARVGPLTVGLTYVALKDLLENIDAKLKSATGQAQVLLGSLRQSVANSLADFERLLGDDLSHSVDKLNDVQKAFLNHTERLVIAGQSAVAEIVRDAGAAAVRAVREADIAAYDAAYALPFRGRRPRVVYAEPEVYRNTGTDALLTVRGNFLNEREPLAAVDQSEPAPVSGATATQTQVMLPAPEGDGPQADQRRRVALEYGRCEEETCLFGLCKGRMVPQRESVVVTMQPRVRYAVTATVQPRGRVTHRQTFNFSFYDSDNNCRVDRPRSDEWCLPEGFAVEGAVPQPRVTTANCGSGIAAVSPSGSRCVRVDSRIRGCGVNFIFNCKGRGWLGYTLDVSGAGKRDIAFDPQRFEQGPVAHDSFSFTYALPLPPESQVDRWTYAVVIRTNTGEELHLSDEHPNLTGVVTSINAAGVLTVNVQPQHVRLAAPAP